MVVTADHAHSSQIVYPGSTTPGLTDQTDLFFTVTNTLALDPAAVLPLSTPSAGFLVRRRARASQALH
ncbi:hypothetical protein ART_2456 [Arthrobacter sp. PAMC 25486]|uniref:hypothetical protein n=1 Tax=Arthrobacter sp. PAMC 25486 TaxID=1494608 RepID=UPI0005360A8E|nr:hypothetical protein [Arthrobacter sp. PAMC 25486]AIY02055.1 hypothetical protein ART_2456 [Arthrobacter sp. PAMC 25486]